MLLRIGNVFAGVVPVFLPEAYDPGNFDSAALQQVILAQAAQAGVNLT
jgi:hypothetical protein